MAVYQHKNGRWYLKLQIRGKRYHQAIPEATSKKEAEKAESVFKSELLHGRYNLAERRKEKLFFDLAKEFELYAKTNRIGWEKDKSTVNKIKDHFGNKSINQITPFAIEKYRSWRKNNNIANATINREVGILRKMFSIAVDNDWIDENPCLACKVKPLREDNKKERFLTHEEEFKMIKACVDEYEYLRAIVICALNTGMRKSEILHLKWECVDLKKRFLTLLKTKSGKVRKIPINDRLFKELQKLNQNKLSEYVFTNPETKIHYVDIRKGFLHICEQAGVNPKKKNRKEEKTDFVFHDLRHTAATRMVAAGIDLVVVKEILGHSDITTTMRYSHPVPERKLQAVKALESVDVKDKKILEMIQR
ncbi:MAG: site-specific integrase [bacterium]